MKTGALIVTIGLPRVSGVTALLSEVGLISAGQRMISAFQRAGVSLVGLVVGPENRKAERQFAQNGVVFLHCEADTNFFQGIQAGLSFMRDKFDRVFVVPGDMPLFLPITAEKLLNSSANIAIPERNHISGYPVLLDHAAMELLLTANSQNDAKEIIDKSNLQVESVSVEDSGILIYGTDMSHREQLIQRHSSQLSRPITEVSIGNGTALFDPKLSMLLRTIDDTKSVQAACNLMQMSYSMAWKMLNHVENELGFPLVVRNRGGASGKGTLLTEKGRAFMEAYNSFSDALNHAAQELYRDMFQDFSEFN